MSRKRDYLIHHLRTVAAQAENQWAATFARSINAQSKRSGWKPSPKQEALMRRLVTELFTHPDAEVLIED